MRPSTPKLSPGSPRLSIALYALISFIAFWPCLLLGRAYFDNDLLAQFGPWRAFLRDQLVQGHFPLWNPYSLGGQPFFADLQNMMLYPFNYLTLPFPVPYGLGVFFFLHLFWSAWGMRLWLRALGLSEQACRVGALVFSLSNFFWLELIHPPVLAAFSWLPWLFWSLEELSRDFRPRRGFFAGLSFAMLFLCGSFQVTVGALYGGLAYFLFRFWGKLLSGIRKGDWESFFPVVLLILWGALPLLGQLIPTLEFSALSDRRAPGQNYEQIKANLGLPPSALYQFLFPRFILPPDQSMAEAIQFRNGPESTDTNFIGTMGYLGIWIPYLVFLAFRRKEKKIIIFLSLFSLTVLGVCFGRSLPLHRLFYNLLPGFSIIRVPYRFLFLYVLGISALAAFGFEQWLASSPAPKKAVAALKSPLFYALVPYFVSLIHPSRNWREAGALIVGFLGFTFFSLPGSRKKWGVWLLQTALALPLLFNGWADFVPGPSSNFDFEANSKSIVEIGKRVAPFRLIFDNSHMGYPIQLEGQKYILNYPQNAASALKIKNFGGYNPLLLQEKRDIGPLPMEPLIHLGAVKGILTQQNHGEIPGFKLESFPPYLLYEYQKPLSYVYAPGDVQVVSDPAKRLELMENPVFDVSKQALLSEPPPPEIKATAGPGALLQYHMDRDEADEQDFTIGLGRDNWLVFPEVMFPGWKATVDGKPAALVTADHLLRAVFLPGGRHRVQFQFKPGWLRPIQAGLALWILVTLGWFLLTWGPGGRKIHA